jgi:uncharacterized protein with von Willebrand factor type A (vWA) domain
MAKSTYVPEETVDLELGNDLKNILPNSRMLLADPEFEVIFLIKYLQRALLQQKKEGREPLFFGPIVLMLDISGSMDSALGEIPNVGTVTRLDWAVAIGLALTILAKSQNRDCYLGAFDTRMRKEFKTTDANFNLEKVVELLSLRGGGGTSFNVPLTRATEIIAEAAFNKADLVFITDGECDVDAKVLERYEEVKKEQGFRTLGVISGMDAYTSVVAEFSDRVMRVDDMAEADRASDVLFQIGG